MYTARLYIVHIYMEMPSNRSFNLTAEEPRDMPNAQMCSETSNIGIKNYDHLI